MPGAGDLRDKYRFDQRGLDANGDRLGAWDTDNGITVSAETVWLRGSESVIGMRLEGQQPVALTIRDSTQARTITTAFRAVNTRSGQVFNITSASPSNRLGFIDVLCVAGTAAG
jgi:hypothetical protein